MDARRFRTEPWMASPKIPKIFPVAGLICRGGHFFLVTFSLGQQRKACPEPVEGSLGRGSGRKTGAFPKAQRQTSMDPRPAEGRPVLSLSKGGDDGKKRGSGRKPLPKAPTATSMDPRFRGDDGKSTTVEENRASP
jgi:hypothetical protein